ncbi:hypothetical protein NE237_004400 [Protea cynaroides]|uniref:Cytochrome P450 n=1 Tax=Protea cynaroides TaxID=273540 RepID=A0A9Q0KJC9_9MAGN|nr:hypothetical protein NE237_004400 [Protea cynaroides]
MRVVDSIWWRPKRLEKQLKQQGIKGTPYKLLHGDMKEHARSITEAWSKPMSLNHQIPPRILPFVHETVQKYEKKGMIPAFSTSCSNLIEQWRKMVVPQGSCELDVWPELQNFSSDAIAWAGFRSNYEEGKRVFELQKEQRLSWLLKPIKAYIFQASAMHPNWQEKAKQEVLQVCGRGKPDLKAMKHLKIWYTSKATKLREISLPTGVELYFPFLLVHHDSKIWSNDADEFKLERFARGVSKASKDQTALYPFGWRPRFCLGQSFAHMEAKMDSAMILQNFSFQLSPTYSHAPHTIVTLQPQHGAKIILHLG